VSRVRNHATTRTDPAAIEAEIAHLRSLALLEAYQFRQCIGMKQFTQASVEKKRAG
jgi:hypothetical protein